MATWQTDKSFTPSAQPRLQPMQSSSGFDFGASSFHNNVAQANNALAMQRWQDQNAADYANFQHKNMIKGLKGIDGGTNPYEDMAINAGKALSGAPNEYDNLMLGLTRSMTPGSSEYDSLAMQAAKQMMQPSQYETQLGDLLRNMGNGTANSYEMKLNALLDHPELAANNPAYRFALDQGLQNMSRQAAASGNRISGRALAESQDYGQGKASEQYFKMSDFLGQMMGQKDQMNQGLATQLRGANDSWNTAANNRFTSLSGAANDQRKTSMSLFDTYRGASDSKRNYDLNRFKALGGQATDKDRFNLDRMKYLQSADSMKYQDYVNQRPNNPGYGGNMTFQHGNSMYGWGFA